MTLFLCPFPPTGCSGRGWGAPDLHMPGRAGGWCTATLVAQRGCGDPSLPSTHGRPCWGRGVQPPHPGSCHQWDVGEPHPVGRQAGRSRGEAAGAGGCSAETLQWAPPLKARGTSAWGRGRAIPFLWCRVAMGNEERQGCGPRPAAPPTPLAGADAGRWPWARSPWRCGDCGLRGPQAHPGCGMAVPVADPPSDHSGPGTTGTPLRCLVTRASTAPFAAQAAALRGEWHAGDAGHTSLSRSELQPAHRSSLGRASVQHQQQARTPGK